MTSIRIKNGKQWVFDNSMWTLAVSRPSCRQLKLVKPEVRRLMQKVMEFLCRETIVLQRPGLYNLVMCPLVCFITLASIFINDR